ncbi:MAG TPA: hypothetical protein EYQ69_07955 [Gemmatimonadetes bacterium]|nr:hypothetical protein [Gemmatimonadota bacterium]
MLILVGYKYSKITDHLGSSIKTENGKAKIEYSVGNVENKTGRRLLDAYHLLDENFMLLYGDNYWPIEYSQMTAQFADSGKKVQTTVFSNFDGTGEYGLENNIEVTSSGVVKRYDKSRKSDGLNGVDIGYFLLSKSSFNSNIEGNISFEEDILPSLVAVGEVGAYVTDEQYYYITDAKSLKSYEDYASKTGLKPDLLGH